jgi:hypothetical protein
MSIDGNVLPPHRDHLLAPPRGQEQQADQRPERATGLAATFHTARISSSLSLRVRARFFGMVRRT